MPRRLKRFCLGVFIKAKGNAPGNRSKVKGLDGEFKASGCYGPTRSMNSSLLLYLNPIDSNTLFLAPQSQPSSGKGLF